MRLQFNHQPRIILESLVRLFPFFEYNSIYCLGLDTTGTASDPSFGPFFIRCSGSQIASYTLEGTLGSDITIFLGFRILISSSSDPQTILGIREATNVVFLVQYLLDGSLQFASDNNIIKTPVSTINQSFYNYVTPLTKLQ